MKNSVVFDGKHLYVNGEPVSGVGDIKLFKQMFPNPSGRVLMGGLGLGNDARYLVASPFVEHVTVYEIVPEVIDRYSFINNKLTIKQGDYFTAPKANYDLVINTIETIMEEGE